MKKVLFLAIPLTVLATAIGFYKVGDQAISDGEPDIQTKPSFEEIYKEARFAERGACYIKVVRENVNDTQCYNNKTLQECIKIKNSVRDSTYRFDGGKTCR